MLSQSTLYAQNIWDEYIRYGTYDPSSSKKSGYDSSCIS